MSILTQNFVFDALKAERDGSQFPIDFDDAWVELGYSTKGNAKRALQKGLTEGEDFIIIQSEDIQRPQGGGLQLEKICLTVESIQKFANASRVNKNRKILGSIYVLRDKGNKALKVGFSVDVDERIKQHTTSNPFLNEVFRFPVTSIKSENKLHQLLAEYRITGTKEWYKDQREVISIIKAFASTP